MEIFYTHKVNMKNESPKTSKEDLGEETISDQLNPFFQNDE